MDANWLEIYKICDDTNNDNNGNNGTNFYKSQNSIINSIENLFAQKKLISRKDIYVYRNLQLDVSNQNTSCYQINKTIHNQTNRNIVLNCTLYKLNNHQFPYISNYDQELTEYVNEYHNNKGKLTIYVVTEINKKTKQKIQYIRLYDIDKVNQLLNLI